MTLRRAAQQALEALEHSETTVPYEGFGIEHREALRLHAEAITSLRAALAEPEQQVWCDCGDSIEPDSGAMCGNCVAGDSAALAEPEQEPVGWQWLNTSNYRKRLPANAIREHWRPLYTAPTPQPEQPVGINGLTEAETTASASVAGLVGKSVREPVAWMCSDESLMHKGYSRFSRTCEGAWNIPVYTAPTPRKPLTPEQLTKIELGLRVYADNDRYDLSLHDFARAVEAAHGITGETK